MTEKTQPILTPVPGVNRSRTSIFVYLVVVYCLGMPAYLVLRGATGSVAETFVESSMWIAMFILVTKIAQTSIDYSGVLMAFASRGRSTASAFNYAAYAPQPQVYAQPAYTQPVAQAPLPEPPEAPLSPDPDTR